MTSKIRLCGLGTTIFRRNISVAIERRHLNFKSLTEESERKVKIDQLDFSKANEILAKNVSQVILDTFFYIWKLPLKERATIKGKTNHERKNHKICKSFSFIMKSDCK